MHSPPTIRHTYSLRQAVDAAPSLVALEERVRASRQCLDHIRPLLGSAIANLVQAGPLDDGEWCLLVSTASACTKLRQMLPTLLGALARNGAPVTSIRLKISTPQR
jgi:Dna[CI] antecedent, DciA